jgi:capsular exopolysaccharide synthesis family protein
MLRFERNTHSVVASEGSAGDENRVPTLFPASSPPPSPGREFSLGDLFRIVRRHALLVAVVAVACEAIAAVFAMRERPEFRTTAVLRVTDPRRGMPQGIGSADREPAPAPNLVLSQMELLRSKTLIGVVVDSLKLRLYAAADGGVNIPLAGVQFKSESRDTVSLQFGPNDVTAQSGEVVVRARYGDTLTVPAATFVIPARPRVASTQLVMVTRDEAIDWFDTRLDVAQRGETDLVDVSFTYIDPGVAQAAVNTLVDRYGRWNIATSQAEARERRRFLKEQLTEIDSQRLSAERALTDFRRDQRGYGSRENIQAQQSALFTLDMRSQELNADRSVYTSLLRRLEDAHASNDANATRAVFSAPDLSSNPVVGQLYTQLAQLQAARDSMTGGVWSSAPTNPDVKRLDDLIASAEQRFTAVVRGQVSSLDARIGALDTLRRRTVTSLQSLPQAQSREEQLQRDVETHRSLVAALRADYENARIAEAVNLGTMQIVDAAPLPYRPMRSLRFAKLALGLTVGLLLGGVAALARDATDAAIRRREELEDRLQMPVLSIIPGLQTPSRSESWRTRVTAGGSARAGNGRMRGIGSGTGDDDSAASEAYRVLRTNLTSLHGWTGVGGQTFVVTSALMREGKTTVAANLALAFALEGKRTLLVDADLRRSRLHKVFRVPREPGLAHVLRGYADPATVIRTTFVDGLFVLTAGRLGSHPSDLLSADRMRKLLSRVADQFDVIIVDTPPVLPVADAIIIAPLATGVVMVARVGQTEREAFNQALNLLQNVDSHIVGAVLNDPSGEAEEYGGYTYEMAD